MKIKSKLIIRRDKWGCGKSGGFLFNSRTGLSCCLGFRLRQIGFKNDKLDDLQTPEDVLHEFDIKDTSGLEGLIVKRNRGNTKICQYLMEYNDSSSINSKEREDKISALFKKIGIEVKFVGKYKE